MKEIIIDTLICTLIIIAGSICTAIWPAYSGAFTGLMVASSFFFGEIRGSSK